MSDTSRIEVRGARVHNLRDVDVDLPRDGLVVISGVSGSGKSSLAFDTIYAEGQRRYVEAMSVQLRQSLARLERPDVDRVSGLSPAIALEQRRFSVGPRATVGSLTELADHLRLLFARVGQVHCTGCGKPITAQTPQQIVDHVLALPARTRFRLLAPVVRDDAKALGEAVEALRRDGYTRLSIDGDEVELEDVGELGAATAVDVVVDRLIAKPGIRQRVADSVELALRVGDGRVRVAAVDAEPETFSERFSCPDCGVVFPVVEPRLFSRASPRGMCEACTGAGLVDEETCPACAGCGLRPEARAVTLGGLSLPGLGALPLDAARRHLEGLALEPKRAAIAARLLAELGERLGVAIELGLSYLSLDRRGDTLSAGEAQRIRLAAQLGAPLTGVLYVLDEPSVGLHPRDNQLVLDAVARLRAAGNAVIVVEHDEATIRAADYVVDLGPGAGPRGGRVVVAGSPEDVAACAESVTGAYLSGRARIRGAAAPRQPDGWLAVVGARANNLRELSARFARAAFNCVTGVSGAGKSSLVVDTLQRGVEARLAGEPAPLCERIEGADAIRRVVAVDQAPLGRSPRSNPATYAGAFAAIRGLFAGLPDARARGFGAGRFSFNVRGGRCEACQGDGRVRVDMAFLPDVFVVCDVCDGRRFDRETLEVRYRGLSIADVLELSVARALEVFGAVPALRLKLESLRDVGLGYLALGQSATTLSGGEAQRVKLARELARRGAEPTLYVLDEPTSGLHPQDVDRLLHVLQLLVDDGHTVVVIEHDLDVAAAADWVVDLGPEAGADGGRLVAEGSPAVVAACDASHTGRLLRSRLAQR